MRREKLKFLIVFLLAIAGIQNAQSQETGEREPAATKKKSSASSKKKKNHSSAPSAKSKQEEPMASQSSSTSTSDTPSENISSSVNNSAQKVDFSAKEVWNVDIFKDESHKVLVIQDRKYTKAKKFEVGIELGKMNASPFYKSWSSGAHIGYHFNEYFALDTFATFQTSSLSGDGKQIDEFLEARQFGAKKEFQEPKFFGGAALMWSPIYGKFAFFRKSIIHFDVFGLAGLSVLTTKSNVREFGGKDQTLPGSLLGVGTRVFLSKGWSLRLDVRNTIYKIYYAPPRGGDGGKKLLRSGFQYMLGLSYLL